MSRWISTRPAWDQPALQGQGTTGREANCRSSVRWSWPGLQRSGQEEPHYCVVTNYRNPLLDRTRFWTKLEAAVFLLFRARRRAD
jgi:hypothetical protein